MAIARAPPCLYEGEFPIWSAPGPLALVTHYLVCAGSSNSITNTRHKAPR